MQQQWQDAYPRLFGKTVTAIILSGGRNVERGSYSALYAATNPEIKEKEWNENYSSEPLRLRQDIPSRS